MATSADAQTRAAIAAAKARHVIADRITTLTPGVEDDEHALVILHLAEAYGHLAAETPRARAS